MPIKKFIYPPAAAGKMLTQVKDFPGEFTTAVTAYLKKEGVKDPQGFAFPGFDKAAKLITTSRTEIKGTKNDLTVRGGVDEKGQLIVAITGILPGPKKYEEMEIVRKDFDDAVTTALNEKNAVVNMTKDATDPKKAAGDSVINRAADKQGAKFDTEPQNLDDADFSGVTTGTVILAAHGSRVEEGGRVLGTKLGGKTPEQIVQLLTANPDAKKNLSPKFTGTLLLSGCFTAAGGIAPPGDNYDYGTYAEKVWNLLKAKGFKEIKVKGMPGQARTRDSGDKSSVKPTEQAEYDRLKKEIPVIDAKIKQFGDVLGKLKTKYGANDAGFLADPGVKMVKDRIDELKVQVKEMNAEKESKVMEDLYITYGLGKLK